MHIGPLAGSINASRRLVKSLLADGHELYYTGVPDCAPYVSSGAVPFLPVFERWFPAGHMAQRTQIRGFRALRERSRSVLDFLETLIADRAGCFNTRVAALAPDLCIVPTALDDSILWALLAHRAGAQVLYVTDMFLRPADTVAAPLTSGVRAGTSPVSRALVAAAWAGRILKKSAEGAFLHAAAGIDWRRKIKRLAKACGYPLDSISRRDLFTERIAAPELVLYPQCFDLPGGESPLRTYGGPAIDMKRPEAPFPWRQIDESRALIYCALGTLPYLGIDRRRAFYQAVIDSAVLGQPGLQYVIALGEGLEPDAFRPPSNVTLVKIAPQLALLRRAAVMISHGGTNSIKESLYFGVPLAVFPAGFDHKANAERARYHGVGVVGSIASASAPRIAAMTGALLTDSQFRRNALAMRERFLQAEKTFDEAQYVRSLLMSRKGKSAAPAAFGS
jgi:UDP:flavonoid glycosyltransferase YjiC (YdhE family)